MNTDVTDLIPQRAPFLFVDKILDKQDSKIYSSFTVLETLDFFKGHFPGNPVMPGVLLQEALFQTGACLMSSGASGGLGVVSRVSNAKFKSLVKPGDELLMEVELVEVIDNAYFFKGRTKVSGKTVLMLDFTCAKIEG